MTTEAPRKKHEPDGLLAQHHLLVAATLDHNLSQGDLAILSTITEGYWPDNKRAFASHLFLVAHTGLTRISVIRGLKRLADQGYVSVLAAGRRGRIGQPGRATEYLPSFHLVPNKDAIAVTPKGKRPSVPDPNCIVDDTLLACIVGDTIEGAVCIADDTISPKTVASTIPHPTPSPGPKGPVGGGRNEISGVGTPPPGTTPGGADRGETPVEGFEELCAAYGVNRDVEAARVVYSKISPDAAEHLDLVTRAKAWKGRYDEIEREPRFRKSLHNWLLKKHYLEDLPQGRVDRKASPVTKSRPGARDKSAARPPKREPKAGQPTPELVTIIAADVEHAETESSLVLDFQVLDGGDAGERFRRGLWLESNGAQIRALMLAAGIAAMTDSDELIGASLSVVRRTDGSVEFLPVAANDNAATGRAPASAVARA